MGATARPLTISVANGRLRFEGGEPSRRLRLANSLRATLGDTVRPTGQGYSLPIAAAHRLADLLNDRRVTWEGTARRQVEEAESRRRRQSGAALEIADAIADPDEALRGLDLGVELDRHQKEAAAAIAAPSATGLALFDEQGTGKTISALAGFAILRRRGDVQRALIVTPKSVVGTWTTDAKRVLGPEARVELASGDARRRRRAIRSRHDVLIANYEAVVAEQGTFSLVLGAAPDRYLLIIDESFFAKNAKTRRSEALWALRQRCRRAVVLCGTPAPNRPWDIVNQVNLADGGIAFGGVVQPSDPELSRERVGAGLANALYLRRLKAEVLPDLPDQQFVELRVAMQPLQRALYESAARELILDVRSVTDEAFRRDLSRYTARRSALLQLCSHPGALDPMYRETPAKLVALDRLLEDLIERRREKVVLWSWYRYSLESLARRYARFGVARIDGSVSAVGDRLEAIDRFQSDAATRLFVGNAAAAGAGITLTAAATAIYESVSNQAAHYMQSLDRIHRRGQTRDVSYTFLVCADTLEEAEFERLGAKQRESRELLGDPEAPPSRLVFLEELARGLHSASGRPDTRE